MIFLRLGSIRTLKLSPSNHNRIGMVDLMRSLIYLTTSTGFSGLIGETLVAFELFVYSKQYQFISNMQTQYEPLYELYT